MTAVDSVRVRLAGLENAWLELSVIPSYRSLQPPPLVLVPVGSELDDQAKVELLESVEYRYRFEVPGTASIETSHPEVFEQDDSSGRAGRLKAGLNVGLLPIQVFCFDGLVGTAIFEVRSRKLNYRTEYQWMLRDIAELVAEVVLERFGTTERQFTQADATDSRSAYQRFAFIKALLESEEFSAALQQVVQRPYIAWETKQEDRLSARGSVGSGRLSRELARPVSSPRLRSPSGVSLPARMNVERQVETLDNLPNRFVLFALRRWLRDINHLASVLEGEVPSPQVRRGRREVEAVRERLEYITAHSALREVSPLSYLPTNNTVLLSRPGYRDVYRAFMQFELAAKLGWPGGEFVYGAGQKNVATLYEYWAFIQLAKALAQVSGSSFSLADLVDPSHNQITLGLTRGEARSLRGTFRHSGRVVGIELWFNRTFSEGSGSWSQSMRPDCSLRLTPNPSAAGSNAPIWLHFDAKYRINSLREIFNRADDTAGTNERTSRRDDLLKMHAYRDAIRRSAGAYVLYPGDRPESFREFHELLPGLGAFALRPAEAGAATGSDTIVGFIKAVLEHAASPSTQHERERYWSEQVYTGPRDLGGRVPTFLYKPPADSTVLLCFAKSADHLAWVCQHSMYNIRADNRVGSLDLKSAELASEFALIYAMDVAEAQLFRISGKARIIDAAGLCSLGYPQPRGNAYFCLTLEPVHAGDARFPSGAVAALTRTLAGNRPIASPIQTDWSHLGGFLSNTREHQS